MALPEIELISNIIDSGDFVSAKKEGVTTELFTLESSKQVFSWLWDEFHHPKRKGEVPTRDRLHRKFPDFDFAPTRNSISALVADMKDRHAAVRLTALLEAAGDELLEETEPGLILESLLPRIRELTVETATNDGLRLSESGGLIRQEYETKKEVGGVTGIPFPWQMVNTPTGGMQDEQFIVIYGRPANMKTWIACLFAAHAWECNRRVMFFSKELRRIDILLRISSILAGVDYAKLRQGSLSDEDETRYFDLMDDLDNIEEASASGTHRRSLLVLSDKGKRKASTVEDLMAQAELFEPDIVFVDGLYLMRDSRSKSRTADWKNITHISQDLKGMAQFLSCPVIGTTQANRANAKQPTGDLDDLSFADALGQDADIAIRVFRGPNPAGKGASIMMVFSKTREFQIRPFVINACPGDDFSILQNTVDIKTFLAAKAQMEQNEQGKKDSGGKTKPKPQRRSDPFRD